MSKSNYDHNDEIQLKDIILKLKLFKKELYNKRMFVFIVSSIFVLFGILYSSFKEPIYHSNLTFVVENGGNSAANLGKYSGLASQFGFDLGGGMSSTFTESNIIEILQSRKVVEEALLSNVDINDKSDLLINYYISIHNYKEEWEESIPEFKYMNYKNDRSTFTVLQDSILGIVWKSLIKSNLSVELKSDETNIINVSCESKDEVFAKLFVEELVKKITQFYEDTKTASSRNTLNFIEERADSVLIELKLAELAYARHKDSNFGVMRAEGLLEGLRLKREVEILNVMYSEIVKNLEVSKFTLLNQQPLINVIDHPVLPLEFVRLSLFKAIIIFGFLGSFLAVFYVLVTFLINEALN